jgi:hypothetical protein
MILKIQELSPLQQRELGAKVETTISAPDRNTHSQHKEHPKLVPVIISCQSGNLCVEIAIGGKTKIVIRWVYTTKIAIYGILF